MTKHPEEVEFAFSLSQSAKSAENRTGKRRFATRSSSATSVEQQLQVNDVEPAIELPSDLAQLAGRAEAERLVQRDARL